MKTFMIMIGVALALGIFIITSYSKIGEYALGKIVEQEGKLETIQADAAKGDDKAFVTKYQPFMDQRWILGKLGTILDDSFVLTVSKDTLDRYADTPLQTSEEYGKFMLARGLILEDLSPPREAYALYKKYMVLFPDPSKKEFTTANNAVGHMNIKWNFE